VITEQNTPRIKARMTAEFADWPMTREAEANLFARGIPVIPDFLCNGGGEVSQTMRWYRILI
jgi:glutamate dehydrogenase (NAD(P)+)